MIISVSLPRVGRVVQEAAVIHLEINDRSRMIGLVQRGPRVLILVQANLPLLLSLRNVSAGSGDEQGKL